MIQMKKISFLVGDLGIAGGGERVVCTLANALVAKYNVHIFHFGQKHPFPLNGSVIVHDLKGPYTNRFVRKLYRAYLLRKCVISEGMDLLIAFGWQPSILLMFATLGLNVKIICSERNNPLQEPANKVLKLLRNLAYRRSNIVVCQTENAVDVLALRNAKIILNPLRDDLPNHESFEKKSKTIVNFCRLYKQKNLPLLIRSFTDFYQKHSDYELHIYGDGEERERIMNLIGQLNMGNAIKVFPFCKDVHSKANASQIFVSSSDYEGLSNSMLEAMALGMACIVTDCPIYGARMVVDNYQNAILVPMNNQKELVKSLMFLAENPLEMKRIGLNAVNIRKKLSVETISNEWDSLINSVLGGGA